MEITTSKSLYELGETPELGKLPSKMYASVIRPERYGEPTKAFATEVVDVPQMQPHQVLVWIMAAGINYNGVWSGLGYPVDIIAARNRNGAPEKYHIGGSDGAGVVWAVGDAVTSVKVGDHVVLGAGMWDENASDIQSGIDPMLSSSTTAWGYEENFGSFAQFCLVDHYQCIPKPRNLSWESAACYMASGSTAYRMLQGWAPNTVKENDPVLIWGGAGGLGSMAIQIVKEAGGIPIAVVSDQEKGDYCMSLGAHGVIDRTDPTFTHWGRLPNLDDAAGMKNWNQGVRAFGKKFWEVLGERRSPKLVFEHTGQNTFPTSVFMVDIGGMVVTCAGTSGYNGDIDLRFLWMRQKRVQGSHIANTEQCRAITRLIENGSVKPTLSTVFQFEQMGQAHQLMHENQHPPGNMAILVNAKTCGQKDIC